jgi:hypothetical protein
MEMNNTAAYLWFSRNITEYLNGWTTQLATNDVIFKKKNIGYLDVHIQHYKIPAVTREVSSSTNNSQANAFYIEKWKYL